MSKHAYLPTTLISDKDTAFISHVIKEVAGVLGITLKHATTKHAQLIGLLERSHMSIKQALKIEKGERRSIWHKYVSIAVLHYNTSYHKSIGCEPSRVFHGRFTSGSSPLVSLVCDARGTAPGKPCSMRSTRPKKSSNPVNNQADDAHTLKVHVDTTATLLTAHDRLQNL